MLRVCFSMALLLLAVCAFHVPANAGDDDLWRTAAIREAREDGYRLIDSKGFSELLKSGNVLVIDARADYEFEAGHIPGAKNLEFDLGDRMALPEAKHSAFAQLAGPDRKQIMVIYCRSFR